MSELHCTYFAFSDTLIGRFPFPISGSWMDSLIQLCAWGWLDGPAMSEGYWIFINDISIRQMMGWPDTCVLWLTMSVLIYLEAVELPLSSEAIVWNRLINKHTELESSYWPELLSCGWELLDVPLSDGSCCKNDLLASSSESSLWGRSKFSSSESCGCWALACRTFRLGFKGSSVSWRSGQDGTQIRGMRSWSSLSLQWYSRRKTSPIWILYGSFHSNPSRMHSSLIQEDGSFTNFPHGMVCLFFPVIKPNSFVLYNVEHWWRDGLRICAVQYSLSIDCITLVL